MTLCVCVFETNTQTHRGGDRQGASLTRLVGESRVGVWPLAAASCAYVSLIRQAALNAACVREVSGRTKPM